MKDYLLEQLATQDYLDNVEEEIEFMKDQLSYSEDVS